MSLRAPEFAMVGARLAPRRQNLISTPVKHVCPMLGVPPGRECSGSSAHAGISEMGTSGVRPCRENGNYLNWVANYIYIPIYSTVTMDSINPKILAPIPSQCTPYSHY